MTVYRYLACDLRTQAVLQELPLTGVSFEGLINGFAPANAVCPLNVYGQSSPGVPRWLASDYLTATTPGRVAIWIERDGVLTPDSPYIIWTRRYDPATQSVALGMSSLFSYFARRNIDATLTYTAQDILAIARSLITTAQANTGGNVGVTLGAEASTSVLTKTYPVWEHKSYASAIQELATLPAGQGFDFAIRAAYVGTVPTATLTLGFPSLGLTAAASGLVFETGKNIVTLDYPEDATKQANRVFGQGSGDGVAMLLATQTDTGSIAAGWPLLDDVQTWRQETSQTTLQSLTNAEVVARNALVIIPRVQVKMNQDPVFGSWRIGDQATFVFGTDPDHPDPRFPTRTAVTLRIVGYRAEPGDQGEEVCNLILNQVT